VATLAAYRHFGLATPDASSPVRTLWDTDAS
jgi:Holliday junction DNA helicase RuvB